MRPPVAVRPFLLAAVLLSLAASTVGAADAQEEPIAPRDGVIRLFNGKDLSGLYTFLKDAKYEDPRHVFTVEDGVLHISGDGFGGVNTRREYRNYHMICEFKWGQRTWADRAKFARDSGVLFHCTGPDGDCVGIWPESIEAQIIEGGVGDFYIVRGSSDQAKVSLTCEVVKSADGKASFWKKGAPRETFTELCAQIQWRDHDPNWQNVTGFRGVQDVESPWGQWTRMDVVCDGDQVTVLVNGQVVNQGFAAHPSAGRLLFQTEGAEIYLRRWELWPLGKAPRL